VDESGISERPTRVRTWAPKGQTPIIQFHFNWNHVSVIAGLTRTNCLFRLHEGSIKKEEVVEFLKALKAHLKQPLLVIWDGLKAHAVAGARLPGHAGTGTSRSPFFRPTRPTSIRSNTCGPGSSGTRWPTTVPTTGRVARHRPQQTQERSKASVHHCRLLDAGYALVMS
jgi:hypothetical protein